MIAWAVAAVAGTIAVWWLSSYLEGLTALAQTDLEAALQLFRTRVIPALLVVVAVAVAAGALLMRQGLQVARDADGRTRMIGQVLTIAGFLMAAVPLVLISMVFWFLRRA